jgi:hypothetical protein
MGVSLLLIASIKRKNSVPMKAETKYGKRQLPVVAMRMLPSKGPVKAPTDQKTCRTFSAVARLVEYATDTIEFIAGSAQLPARLIMNNPSGTAAQIVASPSKHAATEINIYPRRNTVTDPYLSASAPPSSEKRPPRSDMAPNTPTVARSKLKLDFIEGRAGPIIVIGIA